MRFPGLAATKVPARSVQPELRAIGIGELLIEPPDEGLDLDELVARSMLRVRLARQPTAPGPGVGPHHGGEIR